MPPCPPIAPRVIVSVTATIDGRVTLSPSERLLDDDARRRWQAAWPEDVEELLARRTRAIHDRHHPTVTLEGSGTFVAPGAGPLDLPDGDVEPGDHLPTDSPRWFVVVDGRGRIAWTHKQDGDTHLLVLVNPGTPSPYLAHLRRERIPYLIAGDLATALTRLRQTLGADAVLSQAGGGLNGALLRAGLVDELHVITVPALAGGLGTPSITDGPPLALGAGPVRLRTVDVVVGSHGSTWAHYETLG